MSAPNVKRLRTNMTDAEQKLWRALRSRGVESERDARRDRYFTRQGYRVLRFWNNDVLKNMDGVLSRITEFADLSRGALRAPPSPSRGEGHTEPVVRS